MSDRAERLYLECPCCGDDGAESDANGEFYDGQPADLRVCRLSVGGQRNRPLDQQR